MTNPISPIPFPFNEFHNYGIQKTEPYVSNSPKNPGTPIYHSPNVTCHKTHADLPSEVITGIMNNLRLAYKNFNFNEYVFDALYDDASKRKEWVYRSNGLTAPNMYIGPGKMYVEDHLISKQGGENRVCSIIEVSLTHNIPNETRVIKIPLQRNYSNHSTFSPESKLMKKMKENDLNSTRRLDAIIDKHSVIIDEKVYHCGIYKKCAMDFSEIDLSESTPLLLWRIVDLAKALGKMHESGYVHNDLKEGNFLFNGYDNVAKLTDFGCMKEIEENSELHNTSGTPFYADPLIWKNWRAQLETTGNQRRPECDIHSLGKWLLYGFVHKKLHSMSKAILSNTEESIKTFEKQLSDIMLKTFPLEKQFKLSSDRQELTDLDNNNPGRVIFYKTNYNSQIVNTFHFPILKDCMELTLNWIELIKDKMTDAEFVTLRLITELACKMQSFDSEQQPKMNQVVESLSQIAGDPESDVAGTPNQKKVKRISSTEPLEGSPFNKKIKLVTDVVSSKYSTDDLSLSKKKLDFFIKS